MTHSYRSRILFKCLFWIGLIVMQISKLSVLADTEAFGLDDIGAIVVFGDSLSDQGNALPFLKSYNAQVYSGGRFTNGATAVEGLAQGLGLSLQPSGHLNRIDAGQPLAGAALGNNYAVATALADGDRVYDVPRQLHSYLRANGGLASPDTLYVYMAGSNDVMDIAVDLPWPSAFDRVMMGTGRVYQQLEILAAAGAKHFLVVDVPNVARTPALKALPSIARWQIWWINNLYNNRLREWSDRLQADYPDIKVSFFSAYAWMAYLVDNPDLFDLTDVTNACYFYGGADWNPPCTLETVNQFAFIDSIHPTANVHRHFGAALVDLLRQRYTQ